MRIPGGSGAVVELAKLANQVLSPTHPWGKHEARRFALELGLVRGDVFLLRAALLEAAKVRENAFVGRSDGFGVRHVLDFPLTGPKGTSLVRSAWMVRRGEDFPRFLTCYLV